MDHRNHAKTISRSPPNTRNATDQGEQAVSQAPLKKYNLTLPHALYTEIETLAKSEHTTVLELVRRFLKLGLLVAKIQATPGATLIIREGDSERQLVLL